MVASGWGRRAFLGAIAATSVAPVLARGAGATNIWDAVVVGGGLAGLHAAALLEAQGRKVQLLEASDRVGGRLRTLFAGDYRGDVGGQRRWGQTTGACVRPALGSVSGCMRTVQRPAAFCSTLAGNW